MFSSRKIMFRAKTKVLLTPNLLGGLDGKEIRVNSSPRIQYQWFRFCLNRMVYEPLKADSEEEVSFYYVGESLVNFAQREPNWDAVGLLSAIALYKVLASNRDKNFPLRVELLNQHWKLKMNRRTYHGFAENDIGVEFRIKTYPKRSKPFQYPYIGVGYKDKGSRRNTSLDGSPSLAEILRAEDVRSHPCFRDEDKWTRTGLILDYLDNNQDILGTRGLWELVKSGENQEMLLSSLKAFRRDSFSRIDITHKPVFHLERFWYARETSG
jgi:hypothetical protein